MAIGKHSDVHFFGHLHHIPVFLLVIIFDWNVFTNKLIPTKKLFLFKKYPFQGSDIEGCTIPDLSPHWTSVPGPSQ